MIILHEIFLPNHDYSCMTPNRTPGFWQASCIHLNEIVPNEIVPISR